MIFHGLAAGRAGLARATRFVKTPEETCHERKHECRTQRADTLEAEMAAELDYIVVKSRLHAMAEGDMSPPPNAGAMIRANPKLRVPDGR